MPLYPISFSIPLCKIVSKIPEKTRILAHIIPGDKSTYIYNTESDYYKGYQDSWFALTCKKGGWDCLRHYEIIANGCIPLFLDLDQCPKNTLTTFPKDLIRLSNNLYFQIITDGLTADYILQCTAIINTLLEHARNYMTCIATAKYITNIINTPIKSVLYLSERLEPDYLRCLTLIGFKELYKSRCHDYPRVPHIYTDYTDTELLYGRGITYTQNIDPKFRDDSLDFTIIEDIVAHKYDLIVYGSGHRGLPFLSLIETHYSSNEIAVLCGEDYDIDCDRHCCVFANSNKLIFTRELI